MSDQSNSTDDSRPSLPIFSRNATGLVRQVSLFQMFIYNATSTNPLGLGLISFMFALILFPRANPYITLIATAGLIVSLIVILFKSHSSFIATIERVPNPPTAPSCVR